MKNFILRFDPVVLLVIVVAVLGFLYGMAVAQCRAADYTVTPAYVVSEAKPARLATCHCGPGCLCTPCTGNCSVVERLQAEFLAKHPGQKPWIKHTTPEMAGAKSARTRATVSGESYSGVTEYQAGANHFADAGNMVAQQGRYVTQCSNGECRRVWVANTPQSAAKSRTGQAACKSCAPQVQVQGRRWRIFR